jgi:putative conjugative relaxase domain protein
LNSVIHEYCNYTDEQQDKSAILVARNNDRNELNSEIHNRLVEKGTLKNECLLTSVNQYGIESSNPYAIGEKVIFTKNDYKLKDTNGETVGIKNGQLGKIININGPKITVQTNTNQNVMFDTREYKHFDYGYAMTTFKAQGITVDNALIVHDSTQKNSNTRNKIYVDVSRAKKSVKIFTDDKEALVKQAKRFQQKITSSTFTPSIVKGKERKTTHVSKEKSKEI